MMQIYLNIDNLKLLNHFEVEASTIAPAFGNIGLGTQYRSSVSVDVLLKKGIIKQVGEISNEQ